MFEKLLKKALLLDVEQKRYLNDHFDEIVASLENCEKPKKKKKKKKEVIVHPLPIDDEDMGNDPMSFNATKPIASSEKDITVAYLKGTLDVLPNKVAKLYDPETPEHMLKIVDLMLKFMGVDDDMSSESMEIFLYPLSRGAKRVAVRPIRLIGLTKQLWRLCRKFDRLNKDREAMRMEGTQLEPVDSAQELDKVKNEFRQSVSTLRERLRKSLQKDEDNVEFEADQAEESQKEVPSDERISLVALRKNLTGLKKEGWTRGSFSHIMGSMSYPEEDFENILDDIFKA